MVSTPSTPTRSPRRKRRNSLSSTKKKRSRSKSPRSKSPSSKSKSPSKSCGESSLKLLDARANKKTYCVCCARNTWNTDLVKSKMKNNRVYYKSKCDVCRKGKVIL